MSSKYETVISQAERARMKKAFALSEAQLDFWQFITVEPIANGLLYGIFRDFQVLVRAIAKLPRGIHSFEIDSTLNVYNSTDGEVVTSLSDFAGLLLTKGNFWAERKKVDKGTEDFDNLRQDLKTARSVFGSRLRQTLDSLIQCANPQ